MDVALTIEYLIPSANYLGATSCNSELCLTNMTWLDERTKPTWQDILDNYDAAQLKYDREHMVCTPLQLRRALRVTGDYAIVSAMMDQAPEEQREAWEHAVEMYRMDPIVIGLVELLERSPLEADQLFALAATF